MYPQPFKHEDTPFTGPNPAHNDLSAARRDGSMACQTLLASNRRTVTRFRIVDANGKRWAIYLGSRARLMI